MLESSSSDGTLNNYVTSTCVVGDNVGDGLANTGSSSNKVTLPTSHRRGSFALPDIWTVGTLAVYGTAPVPARVQPGQSGLVGANASRRRLMTIDRRTSRTKQETEYFFSTQDAGRFE